MGGGTGGLEFREAGAVYRRIFQSVRGQRLASYFSNALLVGTVFGDPSQRLLVLTPVLVQRTLAVFWADAVIWMIPVCSLGAQALITGRIEQALMTMCVTRSIIGIHGPWFRARRTNAITR